MHEMRRLIRLFEYEQWRDGMRVALETMRVLSQENGSFTVDDLTRELQAYLEIPTRKAARMADHMLDRFANMLDREGDGYRLRGVAGSMQTPMNMLRALAQRR